MQLKSWGARLALATMLLGVLGCQFSDTVMSIAQAPTATATRTRARPTFTPQPVATETTAPTNTAPPPPPQSTATRTPTRPAPTATRRPPTAVPPPPPPVSSQPPAPKYQYSVANYTCEHSGGSWLKGHVYENKNDPSSAVPGLSVAFGGSGGEIYDSTQSDGNGDFAFTLTADGTGAKIGTFYLWIIDRSRNRISDMAGPININGKPETAPDSCWAGWAFFVKN